MRRTQKNGTKKMFAISMAACLMVALSGCGASSDIYDSISSGVDMAAVESNSMSMDFGGGYYESEAVAEDAFVEEMSPVEYDDETAVAYSERKLIKTVDLNVETKEFDMVMDALADQVESLGGYIENMETYNGSVYSSYRTERNANLTIRIPKQQLEEFLETVSGIANVVRRSENVDDVTLAYVDIESHRNALETEQERLMELLGIAETIDDIISIEDRLSTVRYQLESMESQLRTYDNKIDYSTVYLYVNEVQELTPITEESALERITGGFVESIENIGYGLSELGIWVIVHIPYFVLYALFVVVIVLTVKIINKRSLAKQQKKVANSISQNNIPNNTQNSKQ